MSFSFQLSPASLGCYAGVLRMRLMQGGVVIRVRTRSIAPAFRDLSHRRDVSIYPRPLLEERKRKEGRRWKFQRGTEGEERGVCP